MTIIEIFGNVIRKYYMCAYGARNVLRIYANYRLRRKKLARARNALACVLNVRARAMKISL